MNPVIAWCRPCKSWDTYFMFFNETSDRPTPPARRARERFDVLCATCGRSATLPGYPSGVPMAVGVGEGTKDD